MLDRDIDKFTLGTSDITPVFWTNSSASDFFMVFQSASVF